MTDPHTYPLLLTEEELTVLAALMKIHSNHIVHVEDPSFQHIVGIMLTIRHKINNLRTANTQRKDPLNADTHHHTTR